MQINAQAQIWVPYAFIKAINAQLYSHFFQNIHRPVDIM